MIAEAKVIRNNQTVVSFQEDNVVVDPVLACEKYIAAVCMTCGMDRSEYIIESNDQAKKIHRELTALPTF